MENYLCIYSLFFQLLVYFSAICCQFVSTKHKLNAISGGEREVIKLLENEERKNLHEKLIEKKERRVGHEFFCNPSVLGEDMYIIVKFGLVQYVSQAKSSQFMLCLLRFIFI